MDDSVNVKDKFKLDYEKIKNRWSLIPATIDGVIGKFSEISDIDVKYTLKFLHCLARLGDESPYLARALDVGAGIGRVSLGALIKQYRKVDLLEQNEKFINEARRILLSEERGRLRCDNFFCTGLMDFDPGEIKYSVIWIQWVVGNVMDDDLVEFLNRCCTWLDHLGMIAIKECISPMKEGEIDANDGSIIRSLSQYRKIFKRANLHIKFARKQLYFPDSAKKVLIFALKPKNQIFD